MITGVQFDFNPGIDPSGLTELEQSELLEMVAQIEPLSNIGGIIIGSGAASAHPDVTNNPRFIRYIWLDTQTANSVLLKIYQGTYPSDVYADWSTVAIANNSITASKLADYAVSILNGSGASKIAYKQDASVDATKAGYLVRLDAAGQYVEVVSASTVVGALTLDPSKLDISTASNGMVLTYDSTVGSAVWKALTISGLISANSLSYDKLINGTVNYILRADPITGVWAAIEFNDTTNSILTLRTLRLATLSNVGASIGDRIVFDGTNWVRASASSGTGKFYGAPTSGGTTLPAVTGGILSVAHTLGAVPKRVGGFIVCTSAEFNYSIGDAINLSNVAKKGNGGEVRFGCAIGADATNVFVVFNGDGGAGAGKGFFIPDKTTYAEQHLTLASWNVFLFAEL